MGSKTCKMGKDARKFVENVCSHYQSKQKKTPPKKSSTKSLGILVQIHLFFSSLKKKKNHR